MLIQKRILKLIVVVAVALPCYACAGQVADAAAVSVVNMATAIASYQVLRSMGAQPQIQGTPYGMVTTTTSTNSQQRQSRQTPNYDSQNQQDQKIQFMQP